MTREEAKLEFKENHHSLSYGEWGIDKTDFEYIINKIYDSFESRSCENCKYLDMDLICTNEDTPCCSEYSGRYDNFNCNKWEISK